ncbi:glycoside hydrolase family 13 protein [Polychaeton citri CBS 116435]|uniref:Alpha-glucosidase n=1 Tax=Polychaeton citri CBS 116435 TaxID=1314669 RepID=A0A9P4Q311_9PEZI|nr:glycoside hydrolase family 13 protein [Polychaeton citri CBS 116435]
MNPRKTPNTSHRIWWKDGVVYQIYPASFQDSNDDGIGDIPGIISRLDYIKELGVDIVWISPMYDSPQIDMGYDVSDYERVYPPYGTVEDMDNLIEECHSRGMRIILDLVINHTSDQHAWFKSSRSSKSDPKRDWYIWRPAKYDNDGQRMPPNNWRSMFCGSAWEWDENTEEYYLHLFAKEQPDFNWESPEARRAMFESSMEFWLRKGVDGFRIDCVNMYSKGDLRDAPILEPESYTQDAGLIFCNGPRMHEFLDEMARVLAKYDTMTVGECPFTPDRNQVLSYVSASAERLNMVFQFDVVESGSSHARKFDVTPPEDWLLDFKAAVSRTQQLTTGTDAWTTAFLENHDWSRSISRFASDDPQHREASGKMLALMLVTLSGTLFIYQGQELGMVNAPPTWSIEEFKDLDAANYYAEIRKRTDDNPQALLEAKQRIQFIARDNARTPMQWDSNQNAGFSNGKPWMRVIENYPMINAEKEMQNPKSILNFWRNMLQLRKSRVDLLVHGTFVPLNLDDRKTFCFKKIWQDEQALVLLNFSQEEQPLLLPEAFKSAALLMGTSGDDAALPLAPYEGRIYITHTS